MKVVIIGASAAGISAAKVLRQKNADVEIVMISKEEKIHSRCMLHKYLGHERDAQGISFVDPDFCDTYKVRWISGADVTKVDTAAQKVVTDTQGEIGYDELLITSGASYFIPPVPGMREAANVYGFRDLCDAEALDQAAENARKAVIVGAGLVGMDAASALLERGLDVTVVEMMDRVMALQLDDTAARAYQERFEAAGAKFLLSKKVVALELDGEGKAVSVNLESGETLPCDFVIVAAGVRPNCGFAEGSDIKTDRGIVVDDHMRASAAHVYAAGDVTGLAGIWPNAMKQGKIAAENILGGDSVYVDRYALKNTANFYGLVTLSLGTVTPEPEENCEVFTREDRNIYQKIVMKDGLVVGVILQGDISNSGFWQYLIKNKVNLSHIEKSIFDVSFADFYGMDEKGEYRYTA